ncbi:MAG: stage II sporulation protein P [Oscillospiraceae bacterium]|nr:stage II sporulation protein P [Oscillospiraceae bacterium]
MKECNAHRVDEHTVLPRGNPAAKRTLLIAVCCAFVVAATVFSSDNLRGHAVFLGAKLENPFPFADAVLPSAAAEKTHADSTEDPADAKSVLAQSDAKSIDLKATPADVRLLMEEAETEFADQKKDGAIISKTYTNKDATDVFGRIAVRNTTKTGVLDIKKQLADKIPLKIDRSKPSVLIYHTHTTEGYEILDRGWYARDWSARTNNPAKSVVRVGASIAQVLEAAGYRVIHDTTIYDRAYSGAYDRSRVTVQKYLKENPDLMITLDVHRDAIHQDNGGHIKPVAEINGKKAAQVMIITGIEEGTITDYPNWRQNLSFALKLQNQAEKDAPGLMRPIFFCPRRYNMNETPASLLLEFGSDANTLEEALYSGRLIGNSLAKLMNAYAEEKTEIKG